MDTKYRQVAEDLRRTIFSGEVPSGEALPSLTALMSRYGCARETVRRAVEILTKEGLVTPLRGIGTVVRDQGSVALEYHPGVPLRSWATSAGNGAEDVCVASVWEPADVGVAERLAVSVGSPVVHRTRHFMQGGSVVAVREQWITEDVAQAIEARTGVNLADPNAAIPGDLFQAMARAQHAPVHATETLHARMPDQDERETMLVPPDTPVLAIDRVTVERGAPVEFSTVVGDRMSMSYTIPLHYGG